MSTYAVRQLGMAPSTALFAGIMAGLVTPIASPIGGALSDRFGRKTVATIAYTVLILSLIHI